VRQAIARERLEGQLTVGFSSSLHEVFAESRVYVSTQDYDNFSSMSMLEAMSAGNAILARPVGQTEDWVRHERNGMLLNDDTAEGLAQTLLSCLSDEARLVRFAEQSRDTVTREQNFENVRRDLEAFWEAVFERVPVT
jgi:glycosyltransferase involved in cell wall biosynthesis